MNLIIRYSKELYPKSVLIKSAYNFTDRAYLHLSQDDGDYIVEIEEKGTESKLDMREFDNEMLAQAAKYEVFKQTKAIRELIVARAMASTIVEEPLVQEESIEDIDVSEILKDWFEEDAEN